MKLIHTAPSSYIESRLERLASGRHRRRMRRHGASGDKPEGTTPRGTSPKKAA